MPAINYEARTLAAMLMVSDMDDWHASFNEGEIHRYRPVWVAGGKISAANVTKLSVSEEFKGWQWDFVKQPEAISESGHWAVELAKADEKRVTVAKTETITLEDWATQVAEFQSTELSTEAMQDFAQQVAAEFIRFATIEAELALERSQYISTTQEAA